MAAVVDKERYEELKKQRTFYKFTFRGKELEELLELKPEQFTALLHARARRRFHRGMKRKPMALMKKLRKSADPHWPWAMLRRLSKPIGPRCPRFSS